MSSETAGHAPAGQRGHFLSYLVACLLAFAVGLQIGRGRSDGGGELYAMLSLRLIDAMLSLSDVCLDLYVYTYGHARAPTHAVLVGRQALRREMESLKACP